MQSPHVRQVSLIQDILEYIEELEPTEPDHELLPYADFLKADLPMTDPAPAFDKKFTPIDGNREDALVEYLAQLEDAVFEMRENSDALQQSRALVIIQNAELVE